MHLELKNNRLPNFNLLYTLICRVNYNGLPICFDVDVFVVLLCSDLLDKSRCNIISYLSNVAKAAGACHVAGAVDGCRRGGRHGTVGLRALPVSKASSSPSISCWGGCSPAGGGLLESDAVVVVFAVN